MTMTPEAFDWELQRIYAKSARPRLVADTPPTPADTAAAPQSN
jgi:hypothetical protein